MRYDVFLRLGSEAAQLPTTYPFTITMIGEDGSFTEQVIRSNRDLDLRKAVAVKVHKPTVTEEMAREVATTLNIRAIDRVGFVLRILNHLNDKGLLKVDGQPSAPKDTRDWLDKKMDELGIRYASSRQHVRDWFERPAHNPTCDGVIQDNSILTVKQVPGGRVIVLPTGHTIAYTTAREIYWEMMGNNTYVSRRPTVGEYYGRGRVRHTSSHRLTITPTFVSVGCQHVPRKTIEELAARENWPIKPAF